MEILSESYQESVISEDSYIDILHKMSDSLIERQPVPDDSIIQQLGLINSNKQHVITAEMVPGFIGYLRKLIQPQPQIALNYRL